MRGRGRVLAAALLVGLLTLGGVSTAAATVVDGTRTGARVASSEIAQMTLTSSTSLGSSFSTTAGRREGFLAKGPNLAVTRMDAVIAGGHKTRAACHPTDVNATTAVMGFCWSTADDVTANWFPQGITGSGDGKNGTTLYEPCPTCSPREVVAVSWRSGASYTPWGADGLQRISFVDVTDGMAGATYRHVLLVEPDGSSRGFRAIKNHADGIVWYGNKLFLFTGGIAGTSGGDQVVRVFDLAHFWKMSDVGSNEVGCVNGQCSAANSAFALPQIGYYRYSSPSTCDPAGVSKPCFTSAALDRSTAPDSIITTEYNEAGQGRIVRWPLDASTALLKENAAGVVSASEGWRSPVTHMQGGVTSAGRGMVTGLCPDGAPAVSYMPGGTAAEFGPYDKYCLWKVNLSGTAPTFSYFTTVPANSQNVSYWPSTGQLWLVNEFRGSYDGEYGSDRLVLRFDCPALTCS